jgi:hypothetical protein
VIVRQIIGLSPQKIERCLSAAGLPDGFFSDQKSQFGYILDDGGMENNVLDSDRLEYFTPIGYILWAFGNFVVIWYVFPGFDILYLATLFCGCELIRSRQLKSKMRNRTRVARFSLVQCTKTRKYTKCLKIPT